ERHIAFSLASAQFAFQALDACFESRRGRGKSPLKDLLQLLEALVSEELSKAHKAGSVDSAGLGNSVNGPDCHVIWILSQVDRNALIRLAHALVLLVDLANEIFVVLERLVLVHRVYFCRLMELLLCRGGVE